MKARWLWVSSFVLVVACGGESETDGTGGSGASAGNGGSGATDGGSGGTGAGGSGGALGGAPGGGGGAPCSALAQAYEEKLVAAKICDALSATQQCTAQVADALACPCAPTFVDPDNGDAIKSLNELQVQWDAQKCSEGINCPAIACETPALGACEVDATTGQGSCQDMFKNGG